MSCLELAVLSKIILNFFCGGSKTLTEIRKRTLSSQPFHSRIVKYGQLTVGIVKELVYYTQSVALSYVYLYSLVVTIIGK